MKSPLAVIIALVPAAAGAQSLQERVLGAAHSPVAFELPARPGVCGDGRSWIRTGDDSWIGTMNDATRPSPCVPGPVRVMVHVAEREVVRIDTRVGQVEGDAPAALGRARPDEALSFLSSLARRADGRPARDALVALGVADSMDSRSVLRAVVLDADRSRDLRRAALSWLARLATEGTASEALASLASQLAGNADEHQQLRTAAVAILARTLAGPPALIALAQSDRDPWLARQATEQLARSGDPRARRMALTVALDAARPAELRASALAGFSGEGVTAAEARAVIAAWPSMTGDRLAESALGVVAGAGGRDARAFLVRVIRDEEAPTRTRRRAASLLDRAGADVAELLALYDAVSDGEIRTHLVDLLAQAGTREAIARLVRIAREDTQPNARRRAIAALGRRDDPASRAALQGLVAR